MASLSGWSPARKLLAAAIWGAFVFVVALQGPSSTTARPLPGVDEATPEWPCCRQYDGPPGAVPAEETDDIVVPATAHEAIAVIPAGVVPTPAAASLTAEAADTDTANPEWPCCRQYDTPPGIGSTPADSETEGLGN